MKKLISRLLLILFTLEGCIALVLIFMKRQHTSVPYLKFTLFYRTSALSLVGLVFTISLIGFLLVLLSILNWNKYLGLQQKIIDFVVNKRNSTLIISLSLLIIYIAGQLIIQTQGLENLLQGSFLSLTQPAWLWLIIICIEIIILIILLRSSGRFVINRDFFSILLIFLLLSLTWYGLARLGVGFFAAAENPNFDVVGNPILGYQVGFAFVVAVIFYLLEKPALVYIKTHQWISQKHFDILIAGFIFFGAILVWNQTPLNSNPFVDQPRPPNYENYPDYDAVIYDRTAQSLLSRGTLTSNMGSGNFDLGLRPAFTTMLAIFHAIGGVGYEDIIPFQILVYAFLPVLIFLFTITIHSRTSGLLAAILVIIRDFNGQLLENIDAGVHVKMVMSETPMIMGMILFLILFMKWLRSEDNSLFLPLLSGGILGFTMLFRQEVLVILPIAGVIFLFYQKKELSQYIRKMTVLVVGMILVISPWMWRNYHVSGEFYLNTPGKLTKFSNALSEIFEEVRFKNSNDTYNIINFERLLAADFSQEKEELDKPSGNGTSFYLLIKEPQLEFSAGDNQTPIALILDHISNNFTQSVLFLPSNALMLNVDYFSKLANGQVNQYYDGALYSPQKYVKSLPYWSTKWNGVIPTSSLLLIALNLAFLSIGFLAIRKRDKPASWILILTFLGFVFLFSFIKQSGGRVIQKVDWITLIYFSIGIFEIIKIFGRGLGWKSLPQEKPVISSEATAVNSSSRYLIYILPILLLMTGSVPPLAELFTPNQYPETAIDQQVGILFESPTSLLDEKGLQTLQNFYAGGGEWIWGRALYPRQFYPGETISNNHRVVLSRIERIHLARFEFFMTGSKNVWVVLNRAVSPEFFPHGSSVLTIGCITGGGVDALAVVIQNENDEVVDILWREGAIEDITGCPLP